MTSGGFINPENIIKGLNIQPGHKVADFGSGSGYFTLLLARGIDRGGSLDGFVVSQDKLNSLKSDAQAQGLLNINYIRANLEVMDSSGLPDNSQDVVLLANILFQSQRKEDIVKEAVRVLKISGDLVVIDWEVGSIFGSKDPGWKISKEDAQRLIVSLGLIVARDLSVSSNHWGVVFKKNL